MAKKITAIIYDFDGTLTPRSSLDYTIFPYLKTNEREFWKDVDKQIKKYDADWLITFMRVALEMAEEKGKSLTREVFAKLSKNVKYCKGVGTFFTRINRYFIANNKGGELRHYIVSGNLKEVIEPSKIAKHFHNIFASEYYYDKKTGKAAFPNVIINDTMKTQCIFRINKGKEHFKEDINAFMPKKTRAVHMEDMIFIGDGMTDVPSMVLVKSSGGCSIAVYINSWQKKMCQQLLDDGRVNFTAKADYSSGSELDKIIKKCLKE